MADFAQKNDLDLRFGGSTLGDFGYYYDVEVPWLWDCINSIRRNQVCPSGTSVEPAPNQWKVDDGKIYIRDSTNSTWLYLFDQSYGGGLRTDGQTVLNSGSLAGNTAETRAGKVAVYDAYGNLPASITGNANSLAGHPIDASDAQDGQVLTYNAGLSKWMLTDKFSGVGSGKSLTFTDTKGVIGSYNGGATTNIDMPVNALRADTAYAVGDMAHSTQLGSNVALVCVQAGNTSSTLPSLAGE